jgi:ADP-heptose:LPS heptosyltransferase
LNTLAKKILIIRFSSIGDIVLTTPVLRCIKQQVQNVELHYVTKNAFHSVLAHNPHVDKLITFDKDVNEITRQLKAENYDLIIDLHHNLRSLRLKRSLGKESRAFNKINFRKFMAVNFKQLQLLPSVHIVDRYFETVKDLGVTNDSKGLDHFISEQDEFDIQKKFPQLASANYCALVVGGSYYTKKIPINKLVAICNSTQKQFIVLGSKDDGAIAKELAAQCPNVINACGELSLNQSAFVIKMAQCVITSDTGLMHIAAAYKKRIFSLWGNTIPEFGMYPYLPGEGSEILEVKGLACRPCSKLGYSVCPKGHFKCMNDIDITRINL